LEFKQVCSLYLSNLSEFHPRKISGVTVIPMRDVCIARNEVFATAGNTSKTKTISLEAMLLALSEGRVED